ncbi:unnamed protein product [Spirodela intermedia]|uniref:Uncharacterized protein n=1 Tax=Spirodela intermedia TaxID=51605 RepID=A0A7I8IUW0_SPIIN|nr:unnamed protein product [Spirodela intermedia]CAA6661352.1 unnamed protein product [Spirodela intermedia]
MYLSFINMLILEDHYCLHCILCSFT